MHSSFQDSWDREIPSRWKDWLYLGVKHGNGYGNTYSFLKYIDPIRCYIWFRSMSSTEIKLEIGFDVHSPGIDIEADLQYSGSNLVFTGIDPALAKAEALCLRWLKFTQDFNSEVNNG